MQVSGHIIVPLERKGTDGDDGITWSVPESLVFGSTDTSRDVLIGAWRDGKTLMGSAIISIPSAPSSEVSITRVSQDSYGRYIIRITRSTVAYKFDWDAVFTVEIEGTMYQWTVHVLSVDDGITWSVPQSVIMPAGETYVQFRVGAYRDGTQLITSMSQVTVTTTPSGASNVGRGSVSSEGLTIQINRSSTTTDVNGSLVLTVTIENIVYTFTVQVSSVFNGDKGDKGDSGDKGDPGTNGSNAVYYHIEASANNATYYPARGAFSPESITFTMYQTNGSTTSAMSCYWYVRFNESDSFTMWYNNVSSITIPLDQEDFLTSQIEVLACSRADTSSVYDGCQKVITAGTSCPVRYLKWEECADGFRFESGEVGDMYIDIVLYEGSCYQCKKTHSKSSATAYLPNTSNSQYWTGVNYFKNVATDLLLAQEATIENLYVKDVYMESSGDKKTALWISPEHEGMKILKMDDDYQSGRENAGNNKWGNPTTWFHGGDIPTVEKVYSGAVNVSASLPSWNTAYSNPLAVDYIDDTEHLSNNYTTVSGLTAGALTKLTISNSTIPFTLINGEGSGSGISLDHSEAKVELRLYDGNSYLVLASTTIASTSKSWELIVSQSFTPTSSSVKIQWALAYLALRAGGSFSPSLSSAISNALSFTSVAEEYVSQFGANGVFIGYASDSYFRLALDKDNIQHTLLAGGYGLDVTESGVLQYSGGTGNKMPVGGTLLLGHFTVSGSVKGTVWTFDGRAPDLTYYGAGYWNLFMPSSWTSSHALGFAGSSDFCVTITPLRRSYISSVYYQATAQVSYMTVGSSGRMNAEIATFVNGTRTDCDCFVRVDYIGIGGGGAQTLSISSEDTKSAEAEELNVEQEKETEE